MTRLVDHFYTVLKALIALLLAAMVVLVFGNVVLRYGFNSGITVSEELSRWFFVWLVFLGSIVALREHAHLGIDSLVKKLPLAGRKFCFTLSHGLMIFVAFLFAKGSWEQTLINLHVSATATGLSVGLYYGIGLVFSISAIAILTVELWQVFSGKASIDEMISLHESEES
jgi:TRAP-type transport system small permease protein